MIQFRGIADKNLDQFRQPGKQVVLYPSAYKTGTAVMPLDKARGK
jgi:branched-chain amino acid transport system substrate-binding protein